MNFFTRVLYVEISAATGQNVELAINLLIEAIMKKMSSAVENSLLPGKRGRSKRLSDTGRYITDQKSCFC